MQPMQHQCSSAIFQSFLQLPFSSTSDYFLPLFETGDDHVTLFCLNLALCGCGLRQKENVIEHYLKTHRWTSFIVDTKEKVFHLTYIRRLGSILFQNVKIEEDMILGRRDKRIKISQKASWINKADAYEFTNVVIGQGITLDFKNCRVKMDGCEVQDGIQCTNCQLDLKKTTMCFLLCRKCDNSSVQESHIGFERLAQTNNFRFSKITSGMMQLFACSEFVVENSAFGDPLFRNDHELKWARRLTNSIRQATFEYHQENEYDPEMFRGNTKLMFPFPMSMDQIIQLRPLDEEIPMREVLSKRCRGSIVTHKTRKRNKLQHREQKHSLLSKRYYTKAAFRSKERRRF